MNHIRVFYSLVIFKIVVSFYIDYHIIILVWGLAKAEGDASLLEGSVTGNSLPNTKYNLTGIVVHSGQASGGHYYSYILHRFVTFYLFFQTIT